jgi:PAS domain S-box-containing protein
MQDLAPQLARSILDAAPDALIIIDDSGAIHFANRQVSALFGHSHDALIGKCVDILLPERLRDQHPEMRRSYFKNGRVRPMGAGLNLFGRRQDGTEFPVEISLSPIEDAGQTIVAAEAAREIADQAREIADRANQGKSRFLATASHDLRQPLQAISLINGTLRRIISDADINEALSQQDQAIGAMSRLLNALLDISKLESGAIKPEPTDFRVAALFEELRTEFSSIAANKGILLQIDTCQDTAHSDRSLVGQTPSNTPAKAGCNYAACTTPHSFASRCLTQASALPPISSPISAMSSIRSAYQATPRAKDMVWDSVSFSG